MRKRRLRKEVARLRMDVATLTNLVDCLRRRIELIDGGQPIVISMKIELSQLRRMIREVLKEEAWVPGKWLPHIDPADEDDMEDMGTSGRGLGRRETPEK